MKHPGRVEDYLEHITEAIARAASYLQPLQNLTALQENPQIQDAIVRNLEIIGEAANNIHKMDPASPQFTLNYRGLRCAVCVIR